MIMQMCGKLGESVFHTDGRYNKCPLLVCNVELLLPSAFFLVFIFISIIHSSSAFRMLLDLDYSLRQSGL